MESLSKVPVQLQDPSRLSSLEDIGRTNADRPSESTPDVLREPKQDQRPAEQVKPSVSGGVTQTGSLLLAVTKRLSTLTIALMAMLAAALTWQYYVTSPWTRNGSVRVQVANIAPQVPGKIVELLVVDNQFVRKGDVLYVIDPVDFEIAVRGDKALLDQKAADLAVKQLESDRRMHLSNLATTPEEQQIYASNAAQAKAAFEAAAHQLAQAELNVGRTKVFSPVDGFVTNLLLRVGDYAVTGTTNISIIDSSSFWIDGYFEETKMARVCVGDLAEAELMGYSEPIMGHVRTVTRGVSVSNAAPGTQGLPNVDPIYTWVRLAQRVPVRIAIDHIPAGVPLVSGMTATVTVRPPAPAGIQGWFGRFHNIIASPVAELVYGSKGSRAGCVPSMPEQHPQAESIPVPTEPSTPSLQDLVPGLAPGLTASPKNFGGEDRHNERSR